MKKKYLWDEWEGVGELPENIVAFVTRDGDTNYVSGYRVFTPDPTHTGAFDDIISICVDVTDEGEDYE